jgi:ankyrin repeat protein
MSVSVSPAVQVQAYHVPMIPRQPTTHLSATREVGSVDTRPHEQRTEAPRKARRLNHPFQHLYRHDDPVHYETYENSTLLEDLSAREFLADFGGYSDGEINEMSQKFPPLLDLDVMRHLRPKMRFLKYTLGGVVTVAAEHEYCTNLLSPLGRSVPPHYFGARLEKTVAPRHAFLQHVQLPHGPKLLDDNGKLCQEFLVSSRRTKQFCALCNSWRRKFGIYLDPNDEGNNAVTSPDIITPEQVEAFDTLFSRGLMSAARNDIDTLDSIQQYATKANVKSSELVKLLVCAGANPLEKDVRGVSLVHWASGAGNLGALIELINFLPGGIEEALSLKADRDGASPLHWGSAGAKSKEFGCGGHIDVVRFFLDKCPPENAKNLVNMLTKDGNSVLMWAAWSGSLDVCKLLVRNRADTAVANRNGCTVAHWAASGGNLEVCKYLYRAMKVDFTASNYAGNTPLSHAVAYGRADVVEWLRTEVCADDEDGIRMTKMAEDLALNMVKWNEGDSERMKVYDLFNNEDWGL